MDRRTLTDEIIESLKPKRTRQLVYDRTVRHLAVCVTPKGKKSFVVVKRPPGKKHASRRKLALVGRISLDTARVLAVKFDPKPTGKFGDVAQDYFRHITKRKLRRAYEVERTMRLELFPRWENKQLASITRQDVIDVVKAINARGTPYAAHHVLAYIKAFFSYATGNNLLEHSPAAMVKPKVLIGAKEPRQRVLNDDELKAVWLASSEVGAFGKLVQLIIATGTRRSEAAFATRDEFRGDQWIIPAARFKSNHAHLVPLTQLALDIAASVPFGVNGFSKSKKRLDQYVRAELRKIDPKATLTNWTLHDLRRTVRTRLTPLTSYEVAEAVIGHARSGLNKTYNLYTYIDEKREALDAWSERLQRIVA